VARGEPGKRMLKDDERSRNVYENKQRIDNFTEEKDDIFARMTTFDTKIYAFDRNRRAFDMVGALKDEPRASKGRNSGGNLTQRRQDAKTRKEQPFSLRPLRLCVFARNAFARPCAAIFHHIR